jgi:hypothetical protein
MTKEEFIQGYCERSKITKEFFDIHLVAMPCDCEEENCKGWKAEGRKHLETLQEIERKTQAQTKEEE